MSPGSIRSLEDLGRLPFTTAEDLREGYPLPLLAVPTRDILRIHSSSGTTGKRKILCYTRKDIDDWQDMFGRCYEMAGLSREDRVQICVGYGLWTAGAGFQLGAERFGAMAIPSGPGNLELQCNFLIDLETTVLCCTASMGLLVAEEVHARGLRGRLRLKKVILGAERTSQAMLQTIRDLLGVEEVYDIPGLTELYGPGTGLSCRHNVGIHYWSDYYILEILDPESLVPVAPGEIGEMVYTTLRKEAAPLLRYRSRDLTRLIEGPCPCGCILPRHDRILGRSDDMVVFRGVNVYPGQVDEVLSRDRGDRERVPGSPRSEGRREGLHDGQGRARRGRGRGRHRVGRPHRRVGDQAEPDGLLRGRHDPVRDPPALRAQDETGLRQPPRLTRLPSPRSKTEGASTEGSGGRQGGAVNAQVRNGE